MELIEDDDGDASGGKRYIWLDCDPGHDDAMAIILAGYHPRLHLLGVSTVAGNQTLSKVTGNAMDVLHAAGLGHIRNDAQALAACANPEQCLDFCLTCSTVRRINGAVLCLCWVPGVVPGASKPLLRPVPLLCPEIHGESGLDGPQGGPQLPPSPHEPSDGKAVLAMAEAIKGQWEALGGAQRIWLVCTGCLTNAALLLALYPELIPCMEVVLMGGAAGVGNTGPVVEFNIQTDPEAAALVFASGVPLTMVPLEVTHTVLVTPEVLAVVRGECTRVGGNSGPDTAGTQQRQLTPFRRAVEQLLLFFKDTYREVFHFQDPPLHDPCAVAFVADPNLFQGREMRVDIETASSLSAGQTVCDIWNQTGRPANCFVTQKIDVAGFWAMMGDAWSAADAVSPLNHRN